MRYFQMPSRGTAISREQCICSGEQRSLGAGRLANGRFECHSRTKAIEHRVDGGATDGHGRDDRRPVTVRPFGIFDVVPGEAGLLVKRPVTRGGNNEGHPGYIELVLVACALVAVAVSLSLGWWWVAPIVGVIIATYILRQVVRSRRHHPGNNTRWP